MCGLVGFIRPGLQPADAHLSVVRKMTSKLSHRGPDAVGEWVDAELGIALGHRRLSIVELSPMGEQPMQSPCGRYVLVYNGEIYNHLELRSEIERDGGVSGWRGSSDTETLVVGLSHWGFERCLKKLNGMFAFALWDRVLRRLILCRDRMGEKPLYYADFGDTFAFGSEIKALTACPSWRGDVDRDALTLLLRFGYISAPTTIYKNVYKLSAGHYLIIGCGGRPIGPPRCYWNLTEIAETGLNASRLDASSLVNELDSMVLESVRQRMMADVPLGAFLSGGVDSSLVVAAMTKQSKDRIKTFSVGFNEARYNEAEHARAVADHFGTDHTELIVSPRHAMSAILKLPTIYDEPFADSSQIPTYLVSELARRHVTVCLSGDGGDELFGGYNRYALGFRIQRNLRWLPPSLKAKLGRLLGRLPVVALHQLNLVSASNGIISFFDRLAKFGGWLESTTDQAFYRALVSCVQQPEQWVLGANEPETVFDRPDAWSSFPDKRQVMMLIDQKAYLPEDILTKVDRASMAVSLEARVPLLDHRLVEFSWAVPAEYKFRYGQGKWPLRQVLHRYLPEHLVNRPKMGFGVPIGEWLRGPLRGWAEALLDERRLEDEGFFSARYVRKHWQEHLSGKRRWHQQLWAVLMFQAWYESRPDGQQLS